MKAIPDGYRTLTPYFLVRDTMKWLEFMKAAFGAEVTAIHSMPDGAVAARK